MENNICHVISIMPDTTSHVRVTMHILVCATDALETTLLGSFGGATSTKVTVQRMSWTLYITASV